MASNRHLGRIIALQTLYEQDFRRDAGDPNWNESDIIARNIARYEQMVDDTAFIELLVDGVMEHAERLDAELTPVAPEWPIDQIPRMDKLILRMGLYELQSAPDVPAKVVINEAVELAKAFGGDNSSRFINGVLGTLLRNREGDAAKVEPKTVKAPAKAPKVNKAKAAVKKPAAKTTDATKVTKKAA